eukprot:364794-Chlamydomonas_euryale.AAC.17
MQVGDPKPGQAPEPKQAGRPKQAHVPMRLGGSMQEGRARRATRRCRRDGRYRQKKGRTMQPAHTDAAAPPCNEPMRFLSSHALQEGLRHAPVCDERRGAPPRHLLLALHLPLAAERSRELRAEAHDHDIRAQHREQLRGAMVMERHLTILRVVQPSSGVAN